MDCKEKALSNNVYDYITDFPIEAVSNFTPLFCYADIENLYNIIYVDRMDIPNIEAAFF